MGTFKVCLMRENYLLLTMVVHRPLSVFYRYNQPKCTVRQYGFTSLLQMATSYCKDYSSFMANYLQIDNNLYSFSLFILL